MVSLHNPFTDWSTDWLFHSLSRISQHVPYPWEIPGEYYHSSMMYMYSTLSYSHMKPWHDAFSSRNCLPNIQTNSPPFSTTQCPQDVDVIAIRGMIQVCMWFIIHCVLFSLFHRVFMLWDDVSISCKRLNILLISSWVCICVSTLHLPYLTVLKAFHASTPYIFFLQMPPWPNPEAFNMIHFRPANASSALNLLSSGWWYPGGYNTPMYVPDSWHVVCCSHC